MKELRYWVAVTIIWLFGFFNLERLNPDINVASFVYVYTAIWAATIMLLPRLQHLNQVWIFLTALLPYIILKVHLGYSLFGAQLPISVLESGAIGLTLVLVGRIVYGLEGVRETVANLTLSHLLPDAMPFESGQGRLYQEIRRARYFERPAALLAISATAESLDLSTDRFVQEAQQTILNRFVSARIAQLLVDQLKDCDVITQRGEHFITLLPETSYEDALKTIEKLEAAAREELNLELKAGLSTFPDEAVTFESLLEQAEQKMVVSLTQQKEAIQPYAAATKATSKSRSFAGGLPVASMATNNEPE